MSKEKQCECCHEWWYASDIKEDLCPNCYYYFKQLKQQLAEKDKEIEMLKNTLNLYNLRHKGSVLPNVNQLAIQELEKVKILLQNAVNYEGYTFVGIYDAVNNQIKELKGE